MKKKIVAMLTGIILTFEGALMVSAAETADHSFAFMLTKTDYSAGSGPSGRILPIEVRNKTDKTSVYTHITTAPSSYVFARAYGDRGKGSCVYNETVGTNARVSKNVKSSIRSNVFEHKGRHCLLKLKGDGSSGPVSGVWSPDSTKKYTVVN